MVMKLMTDKARATQNVTKMQLALIAALIFLCTGCAPQNNESESYRTPWSSLTGEENIAPQLIRMALWLFPVSLIATALLMFLL